MSEIIGLGFLLLLGGAIGWFLGSRSRAEWDQLNAKKSDADRRLSAANHDARDLQRRIEELEKDHDGVMAANSQLRAAAKDVKRVRDAAVAFVRGMGDFGPPEFVDQEWVLARWGHDGFAMSLREWAETASEVWELVDELSAAGKRNLEETCLVAIRDGESAVAEPIGPLLAKTIKVVRGKPEAVGRNLFELTGDDFHQFDQWLRMVGSIGSDAYVHLRSLLFAAQVVWVKDLKERQA